MSKQAIPLERSDSLVRSVLDHIEDLDSPQQTLEVKLKNTLKELYDYSKSVEPSKFSARNSVPQLFIDGFSDVQIWEQLKTQIEHITSISTKKQTEWLQKATEEVCLEALSQESEDDNLDGSDEDDFDQDGFEGFDEDQEFDDEDQEEFDEDDEFASLIQQQKSATKQTKLPKQQRLYPTDDGFFSLDEMDKFAELGELYGQDGYQDDDIDLFDESLWNNDDEEDNEAFATYADFFGDTGPVEYDDEQDEDNDVNDDDGDLFGLKPRNDLEVDAKQGGNKRFRPFDDLEAGNDDNQDDIITTKSQRNGKQNETDKYMKIDDSDAVVDHLISPYEKRADKLTAQISALETELTGPKRWEMRGEASAHHRELDALVEGDVQFEQAMRVAGPITTDIAFEFEQIIKARIRDNAFDDVQARATLTGTVSSLQVEKKEDPISVAKPRFGLAEQYEREYQQLATGIDESNVELQKKYRDISALFATVANQLDALSNYHYTAKAKVNEFTVTDSASVEQKQEILPSSLNPSLATGGSTITTTISAAPQELHQSKTDGLQASRDEMSVDERQRAIKRRKEQKSQHFAHQDEKLTDAAKAGNKGAQRKVEQNQYARDYDKITKSGQVTVDSSSKRGADKTNIGHNYGSMSGVVASMNYNEKQAALPRKAKLAKQTGLTASSAKSIMQ